MSVGGLLRYRKTLALLAGGVAATGFAPLNFWPLSLAALALLMKLVADAGDVRRAALLGWLFGVGHFAVGNAWIATAFTYQAEMPAWLGWIAVVLLALYLAVYPALAALGAWLIAVPASSRPLARGVGWGLESTTLQPTPGPSGKQEGSRHQTIALVLAFAALWTIAEWLRSWVFTGFAWNPLGMVALGPFQRPGLALVAPWTGTYALSALVVLLAGCWFMAMNERRAAHRVGLLAVPLIAFLAPQLVGHDVARGTLPFTLVQPHIPQPELNDPTKFDEHFNRAAKLSLPRSPGEHRLVLWPESGVPDYLRAGYPRAYYAGTTFAGDPALARARIARAIGPGSLLLTGAIDLEMEGGRVVAARNAVTALDFTGAIRGSYAKAHLVPYGEYLPMRGLLEPLGLSRLVAGTLDFWPGSGPRTLDLGRWGRAGVQICYEIIFSGQVVEGGNRPGFLFNPSNDGWFGPSGPPQHLAQARLRAIEEGLPVLRSTTTGISAVIDADGVVRASLPLGVAGRLDGEVPPPHPPTLFAKLGNLLPLAWALLLLAGAIALRLRRR